LLYVKVHQAEDGTYGVLGIMCNAGESYIDFWAQLSDSLTQETDIDAAIATGKAYLA